MGINLEPLFRFSEICFSVVELSEASETSFLIPKTKAEFEVGWFSESASTTSDELDKIVGVGVLVKIWVKYLEGTAVEVLLGVKVAATIGFKVTVAVGTSVTVGVGATVT